MDVSFTNVLVGARQYFQGLPAPSTAGTTASTDNLATSTSSSYGHGDVTASATGPTSSASVAPVTREASANQRVDSRNSEDSGNANQVVNSYWNPPGPVEPYAPQPTRVEVPDTRPNDGSCTALEVPTTGSLTEMQPAGKQNYDHNSAHSSSSAQLHQLQPPKTCSPPPVYQQLNTVSRPPYSNATDMLPAPSSYQTPAERPPQSSPALVPPRTQYYPRYHHPDITKSTPLPMTQSSTYQSANALPGSGVVQQPATRSSPAEQGYPLPSGHGVQGRGHDPSDLHNPGLRNHGSAYAPSSVSNGGHQHPVQSYNVRNALPTSSQPMQSSTASPGSNGNPTSHQVPVHGNAHTHIPSPHNLPPHIPSPQNPSRVNPSPLQQQQQQQHHVVGTGNAAGTGYCPRVSPHMPPPSSAYHEASPRHAPSPHTGNNSATFQPHSPTYPLPPQAPQSTPHSYPSSSSQHYQTGSYSPAGYPTPQSSAYHSLQKNPSPAAYYSQTNRSQAYPAPTTRNSAPYVAHAKAIAYNGVQDPGRRNCSEALPSYGAQPYQAQASAQRTSNTHNLPPIAALSSYHFHRNSREAISKAQPMHRQQRPQSSTAKNSAIPSLPPSVPPTRVSGEYAQGTSGNHPVNGNVVTSASSMYSRGGDQPGPYPRYATTMAPSHHGSNATSTTVTSNGVPVPTRSTAPTPVSSAVVHAGYSSGAGRPVNPYPSTPHVPADSYAYKDYPSASTAYPTSTVVHQSVPPPSSSSGPLQTNGMPNRKRESPLDLSLRTIKTPADSTAQDDPEASGGEKLVSSSNTTPRSSGRNMPVPLGATYPAYDGRSFGNSPSPVSGVRASTTVRAPKVDFLPNFSSTPLHHPVQPREPSYENNSLRRSTSQHLYAPSSRGNPTPLPNMSTFKKNAAPSTPAYDKNSLYHPGNAMRSRYPPVHVDPNSNAPIPHQEYASDPNKYYVDRGKAPHNQTPYGMDRQPVMKRAAADTAYTGPSKQPRLDKWRLTIDQHIEQRLSSALHERQKREETSLSMPVPNGVAPSINAGYEQQGHRDVAYNYCDKLNYPDGAISKRSRSSFNPTSPVVYPNQAIPRDAGHCHPPQHSAGQQNSYSTYRHGQGQTLGHRMPSHIPNSGQAVEPPSNTGADKRVLSLLRNSLENKQQREEQLNNSQQPILANHNQQSFQNKVIAPVEPKTNIGRHNLSPFTAASLLDRNSTTPPHYKFHVPRAVDSIIQEPSRSLYGSRVNSSAMIPSKEATSMPRGIENQIHRDKDDGLAAILAARIRTKAELKQVGAVQFRAKAQVPSSQVISASIKDIENAASTSTPPQSGSSGGSPPKLTREQAACLPPRRRLFSRTDEDLPVAATIPAPAPVPAKASVVPPRASGFRSSSETSVFDFRESDSEGEMPVLERQTLEEMRRDRRQLSKVQPPVSLNNSIYIGMASSSDLVKIELKENDKITEPDSFWSSTCDKFMEQLRSGEVTAKKRGRRKKCDSGTVAMTKVEPDSAVNTDTETSQVEMKPEAIKKEVPDISEDVKIKEEVMDDKVEDEQLEGLEIKTEIAESEIKTEKDENVLERDSDELPLIQRATRKKSTKLDSDCEDEIIGRKKIPRRGSRIKLESSSGSESSGEDSDASTEFGHGSSVADRLRARKRSNTNVETEGMKLRSRDTTPHKAPKDKEGKSTASKSSVSQKAKPKPLFGDGSDFRPGWEEEVYVYKKSLRMPTRLITVSKPSRFHRLSTSLPDLDPGSPALSVSMDSTDLCLGRKRISDSDLESNCSFSVAGLESKIDDEEATSSTTMSCPTKTTRQTRSDSNSIVDLLAQRVGTSKREQKKKAKEKLDKAPKVLPKGSNEPELLATPSLTPLLSNDTAGATPTKLKGKTPVKSNKSTKPIKVMNSFLLGYFRKETVNNFRDAFKNNHALPNEFSTFVLKSRTRTETRVLKKQATIREVFGEDRPASAPPMQNHGDTSQDDDDSQNETQEATPGKSRTLKQKVVSRLKSAGILRSNKAIMNSKFHLLNPKKRNNLLKSLAKKKLQHMKKEEIQEDDSPLDESNDIHETENNEPEADNADEIEVPSKKRLKLRTGRRKFRSGFDYIRKKKKPLKKDDTIPKERKRQSLPRPSPESVADIQTEIRTWVIKKGVGETILHRAARLGYTDVAAYCLEKLDSAPSPKDNAGYTPLHEACSRGHLEIAKLLLAYGANVSESANGGIRPLHEAAENGATELVRLLLSYGADPLLATYSGQTPLMLASDTDAYLILEQHLDDIQGRPSAPWSFGGPSTVFDLEESGFGPLSDPPMDIPEQEVDDIEMEVSDVNLPVLYSLANDPDKWVLLQDLTAALRVKSRDALLRQVNPKAPSGPPSVAHRDVMRELKLPDFLEQSRCCHLLSGGERINVRASKVTLIKYNDKVKSLLNVERVVISSR